MSFFADLWQLSFLQRTLLAGLLAALACGGIGTLVVARRSTYVAGAIAHCVLGGMGAAYWLSHPAGGGLSWLTPLMGATVAAVTAALIIAAVSSSDRRRLDTTLSALWAIGMAVGVSFIAATPGYGTDLMSYLFGSILLVGTGELWLMAALDTVIVAALLLCHDRFLAISFQEELARLRGLRTGLYRTLLHVLTALTVVLLAQVVGVVLVIALVTLPAATALRLVPRLGTAMLLAAVLCFACIVGGLALAYGPDLPPGATIIELAGGLYLAVVGGQALVRWRRRLSPEAKAKLIR